MFDTSWRQGCSGRQWSPVQGLALQQPQCQQHHVPTLSPLQGLWLHRHTAGLTQEGMEEGTVPLGKPVGHHGEQGGTPAAGKGVQPQGLVTCRTGTGTCIDTVPFQPPSMAVLGTAGAGRCRQSPPPKHRVPHRQQLLTAAVQADSKAVGRWEREPAEREETQLLLWAAAAQLHTPASRERKPSRATNHPRLPPPQPSAPPGCISTCSSHPGWATLFLQGSPCVTVNNHLQSFTWAALTAGVTLIPSATPPCPQSPSQGCPIASSPPLHPALCSVP